MGSLYFLVLIQECWVCFYQKVDLFKIYRVGGLEELLIASRVEFWYANLGIFFFNIGSLWSYISFGFIIF